MTAPNKAREALIVEAIGEAGKLIRQVEALTPVMAEMCQALLQADTHLRQTVAGFESRMTAINEHAKSRTVLHLAARVEEAAQRSIEQQGRAMADAARVAFSAELGASLQRQRSAPRTPDDRTARRWEQWLTHLAAAVTASAGTWILAMRFGGG